MLLIDDLTDLKFNILPKDKWDIWRWLINFFKTNIIYLVKCRSLSLKK